MKKYTVLAGKYDKDLRKSINYHYNVVAHNKMDAVRTFKDSIVNKIKGE